MILTPPTAHHRGHCACYDVLDHRSEQFIIFYYSAQDTFVRFCFFGFFYMNTEAPGTR